MKKYTWAFPFCSGIVAIIGVLTPVAFSTNIFSIWIWGLIYFKFPTPTLEFMNEKMFLVTGISVAIVITLFALILIITGYFYRLGYYMKRDFGKLWAASGILILTAIIISLVSLGFYTFDGNFPYGIWSYLDAGFGAIGPIIGSIVAIGAGIFVSLNERGVRARRKRVRIAKIVPKNICPHCGNPISLNASFCSKCGNIIEW
jgi:hypothetical protein